jgi:ketosteroid isomerase-like protein
MAEENVEILLRLYEAFNSGDLDGALGHFAVDAELQDLANAPDQAQVVKGIDAIRDVWTLWTAAFDELIVEAEDWTAVGDVVIGKVHWQGLGKASGMSIDVRQFDLYELRDGLVTRVVLGYKSKQEALAAAGVRE